MNMTRNRITMIALEALIALALGFAIVFTLRTIAAAEEGDAASKPWRFRPWQRAWQCNDVTVTETGTEGRLDYDITGTLWLNNRFTWVKGDLYFNGRLCLPLREVCY